jgi:tetratricopeptide (TPR) repeat protein
LLALAVLVVYLPVARCGFTNYDDPYYITENAPVKSGLTWSGLKWSLGDTHTGNWHPVTWWSHMLDCQWFGLRPAGHHLTNLALHAANTVLLFGLLRTLTGRDRRSAVVAALFGLHPLHVESVAWVSERKDVLSACFGLMSLWAYSRYARDLTAVRPTGLPQSRWRWYGAAWLALAAGLLSKPMLVTWPFVMGLLDFWPLRRLAGVVREKRTRAIGSLAREKIPFLALSAGSCVVTVLSQKASGAIAPLDYISVGARLSNAVVAYARYLERIFWPENLAVIYPLVRGWSVTIVVIAGLVLGVITALALSQRCSRPYILWGWLWYLGTLVPVIGVLQVGNQAMADRYTYLPAIGVFVPVAWLAGDWLSSTAVRRRWAALGTAAALLACSAVTQRQLGCWINTETLFRHALAVTRDNYVAQNSLGFFFAELHQLDTAAVYFRAGLAINPSSRPAWNRLARVYLEGNRLDEAAACAEAALRLSSPNGEEHRTLGLVRMRQGKLAEAIAEYGEAIRLDPGDATAHYNLANTLMAAGQLSGARTHYEAALRIDPESADAHNNLAFLLAREGDLPRAEREFRAALASAPALWQAQYGLGDVVARQGRAADAAEIFRQLLAVRPEDPEVWLRLSRALANQARPADARRAAERARDLAQARGLTETVRKSQELLDRLPPDEPTNSRK